MILHFSHIGFTDGRTFMIPFGVESRRGGSGDRSATATMPPERTLRACPSRGRASAALSPPDACLGGCPLLPPRRCLGRSTEHRLKIYHQPVQCNHHFG